MKKRLLEEEIRIQENHLGSLAIWKNWGPFVAERAWGTVREDYSPEGHAWRYFSHDMARKRAYRWGEDGIGGYSDRYQMAVLSFAFWNHKDPFLKERLFGLVPEDTNHGEDVKEYYYYLDNIPSHAYMKYLYKYPQNAYPYEQLKQESKKRGLADPEYELIDTGIFDRDEYFDIFIEYVKISEEDTGIKVEIINRSSLPAVLDFIPQVTFRNTWSFTTPRGNEPLMTALDKGILLDDRDMEAFPMLDIDYKIGKRYLYASGEPDLLFTNNETNYEALDWGKNSTPYVKDAFHRYIVNQEHAAINPQREGTKAAFHYKNLSFAPLESKTFYLRWAPLPLKAAVENVEAFVHKRKEEADHYYEHISPKGASLEDKMIFRQALAGQLWSQQLYLFIVNRWLEGDDPTWPSPDSRNKIRNTHWRHLVSKHIISMPDKWEYPWFAAWDLAFHALTLGLVDLNLAKDQIELLLTEQFQHPNGQIPAYEWEFSDINPPVQAFVIHKIFDIEREKTGKGDFDFLKRCYHKLIANFAWWVNREDVEGNNVFEGGFLGLDNIQVFDRSQPIPGGGSLQQSDATGWMGMFCLDMMRIGMVLAKIDPSYESLMTKFFQHYLYIASALMSSKTRQIQNWNEEDGFFYDVLLHSEGYHEQIKVRSLVGLIPVFATDYWSEDELASYKEFFSHFEWFLENRKNLTEYSINKIQSKGKNYYFFSLMGEKNLRRILNKAYDEEEFKSTYGLRSLSKYHENHPVSLFGQVIQYVPGESRSSIYGGNSNWRGPIWFPISYLFIEMLNRINVLFEDQKIGEISSYFSNSLINLFKSIDGKRAVFGDVKKFQEDPHFKDYLLFYEYFHGDTGKGLGASHQTGWTGLVANLIDMTRRL